MGLSDSVKAALMHGAKRSARFRAMLRGTLRVSRAAWARATIRTAVTERTALFESFNGRTYSGTARAVYEQLLADPAFADWHFAWGLIDPDGALATFPQLRDARTTCVRYRSRAYDRAARAASWWITNAVTPDYLPVRAGQSLIQGWHGTPYKTLGADVIATNRNATSLVSEIASRYAKAGRDARYLLSPSAFTTQKFISAFSLQAHPQKVLEVGNPRNDILAADPADVRAAVRQRLGIGPDTVAVLYAPTWRDDQHSDRLGFVQRFPMDLEAMRERLGGTHVLLFRTHYLIGSAIEDTYGGFVIDVSGCQEINDLYLASDLMVTDYSSTIFDYAVLDRPVIYFMYDLDYYRDSLRGLYIDPADLPGPVVRTDGELVSAILSVDERLPAERELRERFRRTYCTWDDGHASERVARLMAGQER